MLDGTKALAVPLRVGQRFSVYDSPEKTLEWKARSPEGMWFKASLKLPELQVLETTNPIYANRLVSLLKKTKELSHHFVEQLEHTKVETLLDFNPEYGFGSSSTLIYGLSRWANIDPYVLQEQTFGGSGFDIACADAIGPITFQRIENAVQIKNIKLSSEISDKIYFVYLGKKQQTSQSIQNFLDNASYSSSDIETITSITNEVVKSKSLIEFEILLNEHEKLMSKILNEPTIKSTCFSSLDECVKSLGAWGGDFVLVTSQMPKQIFSEQMKKKGFPVNFAYSELFL